MGSDRHIDRLLLRYLFVLNILLHGYGMAFLGNNLFTGYQRTAGVVALLLTVMVAVLLEIILVVIIPSHSHLCWRSG